jgi:hypothetical protein
MRSRFGFLLAALLGCASAAYAAPIVYHVDYENNNLLVVGTITTNGTLGTLTSGDIIAIHLLVSDTGLPGIILYPLGYSSVLINSTAVTATADGLFYDTTNPEGFLKILDDPYGAPSFSLQPGSMTVLAYGLPLSGNYEFATAATPPPAPQPPVEFRSEADAIFGTVTRTNPGMHSDTVTINPVAESIVANDFSTGSDDAPLSGSSQTIFGVLAYNFRNVDDFSRTDHTVTANDGIAEAKTGEGSLLGGLIYWQSNDDRLACNPDAIIPKRVDCSSTETIKGLLINRVAVHHGKYPAGTSFPVFGPVDDPNCQAKHEMFSGYLIAQESHITGLGTSGVTVSLTGMHLVGDATCSPAKAGPPFTTHYDLAVGGPSLPNYDAGAGDSASPTTAFSVQVQ